MFGLSEESKGSDAVSPSIAALRHAIARSRVRINVTYWVTAVYLAIAVVLIFALIAKKDFDTALGVFASVAASTGTILGFWFGSRGQGGVTVEAEPASTATASETSTIPTPQPDVRELQQQLKVFAGHVPASPKVRKSLDPGAVDGILGKSTLVAIDNFLVLRDPPTKFTDLEEPRIAKVLSALKAELAARQG